MSKAACSNCPTLARIIQQQQIEIAMLRRIIADAQGTCTQLETEARQVMTKHGSPYKYNIYKGRWEAAELVKRRLKV